MNKLILFLSLLAISASAQLTYPVDTSRTYTFILDGQTNRRAIWPRADGGQLVGADTNLIVMIETNSIPEYDASTNKLSAGYWVDDPDGQVTTWTRDVVALSQAELDAIADREDRQAKLELVAQAIPTLRSWADQADGVTVTTGNAVTVLQNVVDNLAIFYDRFADLLEGQYIDQTP